MIPKLLNPSHYFSEFKQFSKFVITPVYNSNNVLTIPQKIEGTWTMFVVKLVLAIIVGVSIGIFYDAENVTKSNMAERFSPPVLLLLSVLILPLLEEIGFRLSLKFKPLLLTLTLGIITYDIASKAIYHAKLSDIHNHFEERITIVFMIMIIAYPLLSMPRIKKSLELFWKNNFRWILYFFCFGFAWVHIFNYELTLEHLLLMPIITMDKLVSAMCYGYTRVNYGFIYSLAIHMLNNSIGFTVGMLSTQS